jgi:hypothetical protein
MRFRSVVLLAVLFVASPLFAAPADPHIRILDPELTKTIRDGVARSQTFARIVDGLEESNVVVYVGFNVQLPPGMGGRTTFLTSAGKWRYLQIAICSRLSEFQRIAMVAHELHHALEISSNPEVHDRRSLRLLYEVIGDPAPCPSECFETASAIDAAKEVDRELRRSVSRRTAPAGVAHSSQNRGEVVATEE